MIFLNKSVVGPGSSVIILYRTDERILKILNTKHTRPQVFAPIRICIGHLVI